MTPTFKIYEKVWAMYNNKACEFIVWSTLIQGSSMKLRPEVSHKLLSIEAEPKMQYKGHTEIDCNTIELDEKLCYGSKELLLKSL